MRARHALLAIFIGSSVLGLVVACNAIVGVEDVKLRKDSGDLDGDVIVDDDVPIIADDQTSPATSVLEVTAGEEHTCAKKAEGTVKCWGHDDKMQVGTPPPDGASSIPTPTAVSGIDDALHISAGAFHTCVVRKTGKVSCWGENLSGQLGDGKSNTRSVTPVDVVGISNAVAVACGATFSCAVKSDGAIACWGQNTSGQFGNGNKTSSPVPLSVSMLTNAVSISAGEAHACAITRDGKVACWGDGFNGQLGNGSSSESLVPATVPSLDDMTAVSASSRTTCALRKSGEVFCWGANEVGQLGSGAANSTPNPSPSQVTQLSASAIATGKDHACAVKKTGGVACWGAGDRGQLGNGLVTGGTTPTPAPVDVSGITNATFVGAGGDQSCAPRNTGAILCWGANGFSQLGDGTPTDAPTPVSVLGYP